MGLWAAFATLVNTGVVSFYAHRIGQLEDATNFDASFILRLVNIVSGCFLAISCGGIPRRPVVYYNGEVVDNESAVSANNRYTWAWARGVLDIGTKNGDLKQDQVPRPRSFARAKDLVAQWKEDPNSSLIWSLLRAYGHMLGLQYVVTIFRCFVGLGPFYVMLRLIQTLEATSPDERNVADLWYLVLGLAGFSLAEQWIDGWINWYSIGSLSIPLSSQLSALIFEKSLRRKNVKTADKNDDGGNPNTADEQDDDKTDDKDDETVLKSKQAVVNLIGVDARRIADFLAFQFLVVTSAVKLVMYSAFLIKLIGWAPFFAGIIAWAIVLPINIYCTKFYMKIEDRLMKLRDRKVAIVNEALLGMRQIKFAALEDQWQKRILAWRNKELATLRSVFNIEIVLISCWIFSPILLAVLSLSTYAIINGSLSPSVAFVSIGVLRSLEFALSVIPDLLQWGFDTMISIRRIGAYLGGPEIPKTVTEGPDAAIENAAIAWPTDSDTPEEERFVLRNVNLSFPAGELSVISGKTGTGKSLLLSALFGEADLLEGAIYMPHTLPALERNDGKAHPGNWILDGSIAFVGQTPWLESASFRDNILFGLPYIEERYNEVINVCALKKDLQILDDGDKTELGANGINLSGGQKWRVTLARAIYSRAEILVMDDIFSAVDAHVGRQIFEKCIAGPLCEGRTRILVTHHVSLVQSKIKYIVELGDGVVLHAGLTSELAEDGTLQKIKSHEQRSTEEDALDASTVVNSEAASDNSDDETAHLAKVPSKDAKKFIQDETHEKGSVKTRIYKKYIMASGGVLAWFILAILFLTFESGNLGRSWWLRIWTGQKQEENADVSVQSAQDYGFASVFSFQHGGVHASAKPKHENHGDLMFYLGIYALLALGTASVAMIRFAFSFWMSLRASRNLFEEVLYTIMRTPLRWLDTVPVGRILNRMTADFDVIDTRICNDVAQVVWRILGIVGVCIASAAVTPFILIPAFVLILLGGLVAKKYMDGARPMKRLESSSKSPIFELFNATLAGVSTLRAFQKTQTYKDRMHYNLDTWNTNRLHYWIFNRWLGIRMALLGACFTGLTGFIIISSRTIDAAMAGFTLTFVVDFASNLIFSIRAYAQLELDMNAGERVIEYSELKTENLGGEPPSAAWPTSGKIEVQDLTVGYAEDLPAVLRNISFTVANNERVGVVGRTGAGKSSLTLALFRFLEARTGTVYIDGLDTSKMDLNSLRSRLAIIPQDPVLFSGTIRSNLDPFDGHSDEELRDCLRRVHLLDSQPATPANEPSSSANSTIVPKNMNIFKDLTNGISESGGNLSQGQRQLLCIARAIVSRPKIMVLDEATSAVDMTTDGLIQRSIREEFTDCTMIVIAHRLSTIADFDKILVLDEGTVAEFGSPRELWQKEGSIFRDMCNSSGEKDKLEQTILGN